MAQAVTSSHKQSLQYKHWSKQQQAIYEGFQNHYPKITDSFKDTYLKFTHLGAQYQIKLDRSDDSLLKALPPEPSKPTAAQVAVKFHLDGILDTAAFKVLLPFIIYDYADPKSGRLPQCDGDQFTDSQLNKFEAMIAETRKCITAQEKNRDNPSVCKELVMVQTRIAYYDDTYDQIAIPAQEFLGITDFHVFPDSDF